MRHKELALALTLITACGGGDPITGPDPVVGSEAHLYGVVTETPTTVSLRPVSGAVVEVAGLTVMTSPDGTYDIRSPSLVVGAGVTIVIRRGQAEVAQRRIHLAPETRADFEIAAIRPPSLSGMVYEVTSGVRVPLENVHVENSNNHESTRTDAEGRYRLSLVEDEATLYVSKPGYRVISRMPVSVRGDQTLDIELVREPPGL